MRKWLLALLSFFSTLQPVSAQTPYFYTINDENGLPSNEVYCVIQDHQGFMWIGCEAGLFRYDGYTFRSYTTKKQNGKAISGLKFDATGTLWCQNFAGQIYAVKNDSLVLYADLQDRIKGTPAFDVDHNQNLYIGLTEGILKITPDHNEHYIFDSTLYAREIKWLHDDSLFVYNIDRNFYWCSPEKRSCIDSFPGKHKPDVCWLDKRNPGGYGLYANNREKIYRLFIPGSENDLAYLTAAIPSGEILYTAYAAPDSGLWLTTSSGAYLLNTRSGEILLHLFQGQKISNMYMDREGNCWFTSLENGMYVVPDRMLRKLDESNSNLNDQNISSLLKYGPDQLLIGTFSGSICTYDLNTKVIRILPQNSDYRYRSVSHMLIDGEQVLASRSNLSWFDTLFETEQSVPFNYLRDLELIDDTLYFVSAEGSGYLHYDDLKKGNVRYQYVSKKSGKQVEYDAVHHTLWFSQSNGLGYLRGDSIHLFTDAGAPLYPTTMFEHKGLLWAGTIEDGLIGIADKTIQYRVNASNLLKGNSVSAIFANDELLVVSTETGINVLFVQEQRAELLDITDGINSRDINTILADETHLYLGSTKGLYLIPLECIRANAVKPQVSIDRVFVNHEPCSLSMQAALAHTDEIRIHFSSAAIRSRGQGSFRYKLLDEQDEWHYLAGNLREITFSSLPADNYHLQLYAVNEDGYWSDQPASYRFTINAPFWQKWWFYLLLIVLAAGAVVLIYSRRIGSIRKKAIMNERLIQSQLRTIKAQMNPHFIFNSLNSIQDLILQQDVKNSYQYLHKFSLLMRKVLEATESDEISLADEITFIGLYLELEKLRFGDDFNYSIQCSPEMDTNYQNIPSMLLQPFVENAIKHGLLHKKGEKKLVIQFNRTNIARSIECIITDNGIGRKHAEEIKARRQTNHKSFATRATAQRIELLNNRTDYRFDIEITDLEHDGIASGTQVRILIVPIQSAD